MAFDLLLVLSQVTSYGYVSRYCKPIVRVSVVETFTKGISKGLRLPTIPVTSISITLKGFILLSMCDDIILSSIIG